MIKQLDKIYVDDNISVVEISGDIDVTNKFSSDRMKINGRMYNTRLNTLYNVSTFNLTDNINNGYTKIKLPHNVGEFKLTVNIQSKQFIIYDIVAEMNNSWVNVNATTNTHNYLGNSDLVRFCRIKDECFILIGDFGDVISNTLNINISECILLNNTPHEEFFEPFEISVETEEIKEDFLNGDITSTQTDIYVTSQLYNVDDILFIDNEQLKVISIDSENNLHLTIERGFDNTTKTEHINLTRLSNKCIIEDSISTNNAIYNKLKVAVSNQIIINGEAEYNEYSSYSNDYFIPLKYIYDQLNSEGNVKSVGSFFDGNYVVFEGDTGNIIKDSGLNQFNLASVNEALKLDNNTPYEPILPYNPATKKFVDDNSIYTLQGFYTSSTQISVGNNETFSVNAVPGDSCIWNYKIFNDEKIRKGRLFVYLKNSSITFKDLDDINYMGSDLAIVSSSYVNNTLNINIINNSNSIITIQLWRQNI